MKITCDKEFLVSCTVIEEGNFEGLPMTVTSTEDHPEFTKIRDMLEDQGYIETQRNCWNSDTALKAFTFNDEEFLPGDQFPCGVALGYH